jgi:hypothetical protein
MHIGPRDHSNEILLTLTEHHPLLRETKLPANALAFPAVLFI